MSSKVVNGIVNYSGEGHSIEADGIHKESELIVSFPVERISLFIDQGYVGLFDLRKEGMFYFSHVGIKYRYFVGSKILQVIFDGDQL